MYPLETRELAVEAVAAGFSLTEAAELAGCSRTAVVNWAKAAGVAPPPRKKAVYLPFDRKMELVARLEAGERAADLAAEAGVTAAAVSGWRRRLREEGALSLMTDSDIAARAPEPPRGALGARGAQGPLRGAGAAQRRPRGDDRHTKKRPRRRPVRPDGGGEGGAG